MAASDITAKPASGQGTQTIAITVPANTGNKRTYTLTATTASGKTATLTVVQKAALIYKLRMPETYTVPASGGSITLIDKAGVAFVDVYEGDELVRSIDVYTSKLTKTALIIDAEYWLSGGTDTIITYNTRGTTEGDARYCRFKISVQNPDSSSKKVEATVTVTQVANVKSLTTIDIKTVLNYSDNVAQLKDATSNTISYNDVTFFVANATYDYSSGESSILSSWSSESVANDIKAHLTLDMPGVTDYTIDRNSGSYRFFLLNIKGTNTAAKTDTMYLSFNTKSGKFSSYIDTVRGYFNYNDENVTSRIAVYRLCKTFKFDFDKIFYPFAINSDTEITIGFPKQRGSHGDVYGIVYTPDIMVAADEMYKYPRLNGSHVQDSASKLRYNGWSYSSISGCYYNVDIEGSAGTIATLKSMNMSIWCMKDDNTSVIDKTLKVNVNLVDPLQAIYVPAKGSTTYMKQGDTKYFGIYVPSLSTLPVSSVTIPESDDYVDVYYKLDSYDYKKVTSSIEHSFTANKACFVSVKMIVKNNPVSAYSKDIKEGSTAKTLQSVIIQPVATHKTLKLKGGPFCVGNPDDIIDSISGKNLTFTLTDGGNSSNSVSFTCSSYEITISENSGTEIYWEDYDNVQAFYRTMSVTSFSLEVTDDDGNAIVNAPAINKDALEVFAGDFDSHDTPIVFEFGKKHVSFEGTLYVNADQYISSSGLIGVFLNCTSGNRYFVKALEYNYGSQDSLNLFEQGGIIEIDADDIPENLEFAVTDDASMSDVENIDNYTTTVSYIQPNNDEATVKVTTLEGVTIIEGYTVSYDSCMKFSEVMYCPDMSRIEFSGQDESNYYFWFY